jgi:hypothetical protein
VAVEITVEIRVKKGKQRPEFMGMDAGFQVGDKPASIRPGKIRKLVILALVMGFIVKMVGQRLPFMPIIKKF